RNQSLRSTPSPRTCSSASSAIWSCISGSSAPISSPEEQRAERGRSALEDGDDPAGTQDRFGSSFAASPRPRYSTGRVSLYFVGPEPHFRGSGTDPGFTPSHRWEEGQQSEHDPTYRPTVPLASGLDRP